MTLLRLAFGLLALTPAGLAPAAGAPAGTAYDYAFTSIDGAPMPLDAFAGKAILVVNTASRCGFTRQYAGLQALWERFGDRGLVVLGVPSNDFGAQEPGSEAAIKEFCETTFGIDFPLTRKEKVRGPEAHPFYRWAAEVFGAKGLPRWNFHKYLVAADGRLVDWFSTATAPGSPRLIRAIEAAMPRPAASAAPR